MPSMRLNTQANAGLSDPTEWQTVSAKAKAKTKTKSEVRWPRQVANDVRATIALLTILALWVCPCHLEI